MDWEIEYTDEFGAWWQTLTLPEQEDIVSVVNLLEEHGPSLRFPFSSGISSSIHEHMRELRIQHSGEPYRILYAFDPRRHAILLIGGNKSGEKRWYEKFVPQADKLYNEHLEELRKEGLLP